MNLNRLSANSDVCCDEKGASERDTGKGINLKAASAAAADASIQQDEMNADLSSAGLVSWRGITSLFTAWTWSSLTMGRFIVTLH